MPMGLEGTYANANLKKRPNFFFSSMCKLILQLGLAWMEIRSCVSLNYGKRWASDMGHLLANPTKDKDVVL
jgi:hypothetical protein